MSRTNQPKFRPSLTLGDMIDCISALQAFNSQAPVLNIFRQQVAKVAMTNPELFGGNAALKLNAIMHNHGSIAKAENPNTHTPSQLAQVSQVSNPVFGDPSKYPAHNSAAQELAATFDQIAQEANAAKASKQLGYPDEQLPEPVRIQKEAAYITLVRSGILSMTADDYAFKVSVDTWMMENKETILPSLGITEEALAMYCPLAGKPLLEI